MEPTSPAPRSESRPRLAGRPNLLAWALLVVAAPISAGCDSRPPTVPRPDTGPRDVDSGLPLDSGVVIGGRRDGGPQLPPVDRVIVLPYLGEPVEQELQVRGEVGELDVFFSIDTTGSFSGEIDNLQAELRTVIVPQLRARVADVAFGVGRFEDFPVGTFGAPTDHPFELLSALTSDDSRVDSAVARLDNPLGNGADIPESGAEALFQIATGEGRDDGTIAPFSGRALPGGGRLGGVGFRSGSLRVVVHVTDATTHEPDDYAPLVEDTHSLLQAIEALAELRVRTIGIASGGLARPHLETIAQGTSAVVDAVDGVCPTGVSGATRPAVGGRCPLVFDVRADGSGLSSTVVDAIADLLDSVAYEEVWGESDDTLGFVRAIEAREASPPPGSPPVERADRRPADDGVLDTFLDVRPGTELTLVALLRNETIPPADYDQIFNVELRVVGDDVTLDRRALRIVVPRGRLDAGPIDAGPGVNDAGPSDAGSVDAGPSDAGSVDAGPSDAGSVDAGPSDAGADAGSADAGSLDAGAADAG